MYDIILHKKVIVNDLLVVIILNLTKWYCYKYEYSCAIAPLFVSFGKYIVDYRIDTDAINVINCLSR